MTKVSARLIKISIAISFIFTSMQSSVAGIYEALCDESNCKIKLSAKGFSGPEGFMPAHRIVQWYQGGGAEINKSTAAAGAGAGAIGGAVVGGLATCWTVVACVPGIIAGGSAGGISGSTLGNSADLYFTVLGYNQKGEKILQTFNFINERPASKIIQELSIVTGLKMGEQRSVDEIKKIDNLINSKESSEVTSNNKNKNSILNKKTPFTKTESYLYPNKI